MTRLKALELFGFKSFADRTRFEFPEGITVVVGPNGSGKSNVVDAIKWVLGEQSVRSLRGRDMTDVIFAGSVSRKPLNAAETSLIFDNGGRRLPIDADDVQITRRVYRSGESEYLVNGEVSRLRDIRELFSGTGAATEAYSVIEQGRVDALLVASGRDRRSVFEEAAGITRFRARRSEALRRLERAEQNRQRLADIVGEVSSRLETVKHQAARARRHRQLTDRLRLLRLSAATADLGEADTAVARVDATLADARDRFVTAEAEASVTAETSCRLEAQCRDLEPRLASAHERLAHHRQALAAAETTLVMLRRRQTELDADAAQRREQTRAATVRERAAAAALDAAVAQADAVAAQFESLATALTAREAAVAGSRESAAALRGRLREQRDAVSELERRLQRLEADVDRVTEQAEESRRVADEATAAVTGAREHHARLAEAVAGRDGALGALEARFASTTHELERHESMLREHGSLLETAWHELASWQAKLEACRERRRLLEEITDRHESLSEAARALLRPDGPTVPGLCGVVGDLIDAPLEWAALVDAVLGPTAQGIVVRSLDEAIHWFALWQDTPSAAEVLGKGGRIPFLVAGRPPAVCDTDLSGHAGVIGRLADLVIAGQPDSPQACLVHLLLDHVWVVERLDHARELVRRAPAGTIAVTASGVCLSTAGTFEVGMPGATPGMVARRSELKALRDRDAELTATTTDAENRIRGLRAGITQLQQDIRRLQSRRQQEAETMASARAEAEALVRDCAAAQSRIAVAETAAVEAERRAAGLTRALGETLAAGRRLRGDLEAARTEEGRTAAALDALDRDRGDVLSELNRLHVEQATCAERLAAGRELIETRKVSQRSCAEEVAEARGQEAASVRRREAFDLELLAAGAALAEEAVEAERAARSLADLSAHRDRLTIERQAAMTASERARAEMLSLGEAIHARELEAGETRHRRARILERIRDDYDIDLEAEMRAGSAVPAPPEGETVPADRAELEAEIELVRRKLGGLSSVNLEALTEADALAERLATLSAQLDDVTNAKQAIERLIAQIDEESRRLLGETIETVRGYFRELFERLFAGGQADIVLDPDVDLLETSVEIVARPPGKEPRSISLLSGGEKTMTCVALLLAIFRSRPSPFCVLDEVDAALDEANVDRFVGVLRDFLSSTQFIVVTHSKKTMAAADTLYGVTMEESGVSKRVSVRFESTVAQTGVRPARAA